MGIEGWWWADLIRDVFLLLFFLLFLVWFVACCLGNDRPEGWIKLKTREKSSILICRSVNWAARSRLLRNALYTVWIPILEMQKS